jgi:hypothetical protein
VDGGAGIQGSLDWNALSLSATVSISLDNYGIKLPGGRSLAEETLAVEFFSRIRPKLLALPIDSSSTLQDMMNAGSLTASGLDAIIFSVRQQSPVFSTSLSTLTSSYTMDLKNLADLLVHHTRAAEAPRVLNSVFAGDYTGIIIVADGSLPIHGKRTQAFVLPCLLPKVWDSGMRLIYSNENVANSGDGVFKMVHYAARNSIMMPTPSGLTPEIAAITGTKPLVLLAKEVYGTRPTDIVIETEDAERILSREANRNLLRDGKVVIILRDDVIVSGL